MKTKEELNALKEEVETVSRKLHELTEEELAEVTGGSNPIPGAEFVNIDYNGLNQKDIIELQAEMKHKYNAEQGAFDFR